MIARMWHGVTLVENSEAFLEYMQNTGVKKCSAAGGNHGVYVLRRRCDAHVEFIFLTLWETYDSIRIFAGELIEKPVYFSEDAKYLVELEQAVKHYDVVVEQFSPGAGNNVKSDQISSVE